MKITSTSFNNNKSMDIKYSGYGDGISPQFTIEEIPKNAKSLIIVVHDIDAPLPGGFRHMIMANVTPENKLEIEEGQLDSLGKLYLNDSGTSDYLPPKPPEWHKAHKYNYHFYAVDFENVEDKLKEIGAPILPAYVAFIGQNMNLESAVYSGIYDPIKK